MKWFASVLLASAPALAEVPGGHFYYGAGSWWAIPTTGSGNQRDFGLSVELQYEFSYVLLGVSLSMGGLTGQQPSWGPTVSAHAGVVLPTRFAPYLAAGVAYLSETVNTHFDCYGGCIRTAGSGPAFLLEGGVLLFRELQFGRIAVVGQAIFPQFNVPNGYNGSPDYPSIGFVLLGVRIFG